MRVCSCQFDIFLLHRQRCIIEVAVCSSRLTEDRNRTVSIGSGKTRMSMTTMALLMLGMITGMLDEFGYGGW